MENNVINLDLKETQKTTIHVNGDASLAFDLNLSDFSIYERLRDGMKQLYSAFEELKNDMGTKAENEEPDDDAENDEVVDAFIEMMKKADLKMRNIVDYIFDAPVSAVCVPSGYMFDVFNGMLRFEYIINALTKLYESNLNKEFYKLRARIDNKLPAYAKKGH